MEGDHTNAERKLARYHPKREPFTPAEHMSLHVPLLPAEQKRTVEGAGAGEISNPFVVKQQPIAAVTESPQFLDGPGPGETWTDYYTRKGQCITYSENQVIRAQKEAAAAAAGKKLSRKLRLSRKRIDGGPCACFCLPSEDHGGCCKCESGFCISCQETWVCDDESPLMGEWDDFFPDSNYERSYTGPCCSWGCCGIQGVVNVSARCIIVRILQYVCGFCCGLGMISKCLFW